jgi:hypothetical protein
MLLIAIGINCPTGSGPRSSVSLRRIVPLNVVPDTTVPTPGTEYYIEEYSRYNNNIIVVDNIILYSTESSIENSAGSSAPGVILADNKFIKVLSRSRFRPDTLDT